MERDQDGMVLSATVDDEHRAVLPLREDVDGSEKYAAGAIAMATATVPPG